MTGLYIRLAAAAIGLVVLLGVVLWHACEPLAYAGRHEATSRHRAADKRTTAAAAALPILSPAYTGGTR